MRGFGLAACAAALVLSASAAGASPLSGSDTMIEYGDTADAFIGGPGYGGFLLTVTVDKSRLTDLTGFMNLDYTGYYDTSGGWLPVISVLNAQINYDPNQPWMTDSAGVHELKVTPTAEGFTVLFNPIFDCPEQRGRSSCFQFERFQLFEFNGKFIGDEPIEYSWAYSALPPTNAIPEPATWAMMIMGFGLVGAGLRRRAALAA